MTTDPQMSSRSIFRAHRSTAGLSIVLLIAFLLALLNAAINFPEALHRFFGAFARFSVTTWIVNGLFCWLAVLLWAAFSRWRQTERERTELERVLSSISPDALLVVSPDRTVVMANASTQRLLGYEPQEVIGRKTDLLYYDRRSRPDAGGEIYQALERDGFHIGLATGRHRNGTNIPLEIVSGEMSHREGAVLLLRDIADRVRAGQAHQRVQERLRRQRKLESLGVLAGGVAHDFNNLLAGILGNAELAAMKLGGQAPSDNVIEINRAATKAAGLCRDMLAYAGKGRRRVLPLDLSELVHSMAHILRVTVPQHQKIEYVLGCGIPPINGDASQIQQVVMYLAANAADAIGANEGTVTIRTGTLQCDAEFLNDVFADEPIPPGCHAFIEVADTGCGMDADTRARILEPFFTTKHGHRGLGLASIRGIVSSHGGAIKVRSEDGKGSSFMVLLPFQGAAAASWQCELPPPAPAPAPADDLATWQGKGTVLVVEDEPLVGRYVEQALRSAGLTVFYATDGEEGVRVFRERSADIDLTLLDMSMPRMSGAQVLDAMRQVRPDAAIILCSGDLSSCSGLPADGFLQKPFALNVLLRTVRDALAGKRAPT